MPTFFLRRFTVFANRHLPPLNFSLTLLLDIVRLPFLMRSLTFPAHAARPEPAGGVIAPFIVTRIFFPTIFADSLLPLPSKETGSAGALAAFVIVMLAVASPTLPAWSANVTFTE